MMFQGLGEYPISMIKPGFARIPLQIHDSVISFKNLRSKRTPLQNKVPKRESADFKYSIDVVGVNECQD